MRTALTLTSIGSFFILQLSCSKGGNTPDPPPNPCAGVTITVTATATNATSGQSNGSIAASATGSTGFTFSLNSGSFQASGNFSNLAAGNYTITARDGNGCTGSRQVTVGTNNPCAGVNITISTSATTATPCVNPANGSLNITASGSTNLMYSLNGTTFQASNVFSNLGPGNYTVTVRDGNGCSNTASTSVAASPPGTLFSAVRTVIQTNCAVANCHVPPAPTGGIDFTQDCNIVANRDRIKARAVDGVGTAQQMPPPPNSPLSATDRQRIVDWINAGGQYNN